MKKLFFALLFLVFIPCYSMDDIPTTYWPSIYSDGGSPTIDYDPIELANKGVNLWNAGQHYDGILCLGMAQEKGIEVAFDSLETIYEVLLKSLPNNPNAPYLLGILHEHGWATKKNLKIASLWYQMAGMPSPTQPAKNSITKADAQEHQKKPFSGTDQFWAYSSISDKAAHQFAQEQDRLKIKLGGSVWAGNKKLSKILKKPVDITSYIYGYGDESGAKISPFSDSPLGPIFKQKLKETYGFDVDGDIPIHIKAHELKPLQYQEENSPITWKLNTKKYIKELIDGPPVWPVYDEEGIDFLGHTKNKMGDICFERTYILDQYGKAVGPSMSVIDIGTATGKNAYDALKKGAWVTALDLSLDHLAYLFRYAPTHLRKRLWINTNKFPSETNFLPKSKNVALLSHVVHYLPGQDIRLGFKKIHDWLDDNGLLFIQTLSPYAAPFVFRALEADTLLDQGHEWPGYFSNIYVNEGMPSFGHPLHPSILERELKNAGFAIRYINYASYDQKQNHIEPFPVSYQETEKYFKNHMAPDEVKNFEAKLAALDPRLLGRLTCDRQLYKNKIAVQNGSSSSSSFIAQFPHEGALQSVSMVQAIAVKVK